MFYHDFAHIVICFVTIFAFPDSILLKIINDSRDLLLWRMLSLLWSYIYIFTNTVVKM